MKKYSTTQLLTQDNPILKKNQKENGEGGLRTKGYFKKSYEDKPLISIITVVFNGKKYLEQTIQSVINQIYDNVEYIIIDGGSTDGTVDIIKKYEDQIDYWVSKKDYGLYHAMNKGIENATGDIVGMINADDYYYENAFQNVVNSYNNKSLDEFIFFGDYVHGDVLIKGWRPESLKLSAFGAHPSMFAPKKIYDRIGAYKLQYKILSDYDFMYRAFHQYGIQAIYLPEKVAFFRPGGLSSQHIFRAYTEEMLIKIDNGEKVYKAFFIYIVKLVKFNIIRIWK